MDNRKPFTVLMNCISRNIRKIKTQEMAEDGLRSVHVSRRIFVRRPAMLKKEANPLYPMPRLESICHHIADWSEQV